MASEHSNLYVTGLPDGMDDVTFRSLFEEYGVIISSRVVSNNRYGFVKFSSKAEAQACIDATNGGEYAGSILLVRFADNDHGSGAGHVVSRGAISGAGRGLGGKGGQAALPAPQQARQPHHQEPQPQDNLYIKGLPGDMTEDFMRQIFGAYGQVISVKVMSYGDSCSALMKMGSSDLALWMVENLDGNMPQGLDSPLTIRFANPPGTKPSTGVASSYGPITPLKPQPSARPSPYNGSPAPAPAPKLHPQQEEEITTAVNCVGAAMGVGKQFVADGDPSNLYVKNLPGAADDLYLYKIFAPFGAVQSVYAKTGDNGAWAIGFVKYAFADDAEKAIAGLHGAQLPDGTVLHIQVKTSNRGNRM